MFGGGLRAIGPTVNQYLVIPAQHHALKRSQLAPLAYRVTTFSTSCSRLSEFAANSGRQGGTQFAGDSREAWYKRSRGGYTGVTFFAFILGGVGIITFAVSDVASADTPPSKLTAVSLPKTPAYSEMPVPGGHLGNLTAEQEAKLRSLWAVTLKTFGVTDPSAPEKDIAPTQELADAVSTSSPEKEKKKRRLFSRKHDKDKAGNGGDGVAASPGLSAADDDKYGQTKEFYEILEKQTPEELRTAFWTMVKADHPDALLLRFLRARKWDVDKALAMLISTMHWRSAEMLVDEDVIKHGEGGAQEDSQSSDKAVKKEGEDFLQQLKLGKSFLHGTDKEGRPICVVRVRLHKPGEQSERSMERYTVFVIETARLVLRPPVDTACIIFDMSHFSLSNMDYTPVRFMIKCFEANYPESLGVVLVHKAPFVFSAIWNIIKGWLDPVVASKIHFTRQLEDLEQYIPRSQIMKELGGDEDWEYEYIEPIPGENEKFKDEAPRIKLEEERKADVLEYEKKTFDWIAGRADADSVKKERDMLAQKLRDNYWHLDPYIRARTIYDRTGMIQKGGKINFYPEKRAINGVPPPTVVPHADDVD